MSKITWQQLGLIFEGQFGVTAEEATEIISKEIFSNNWKHGAAKTAGVMWRDEYIQELFKLVLIDEDILVEKVGRKKVQKEFIRT